MKQQLETLLLDVITLLQSEGVLDSELSPVINIERTRDPLHGDFSTNLAMMLAKPAKMNPRQLAEKIINHLAENSLVTKVEIAGPGFINFFIDANAHYQIIKTIHSQGESFGLSQIGAGKKVQVEFVSANPTGPLHVGHGRGAVYGSAVADLLVAVGFDVHREYYVNDAGRQMDILAASIWLRYLEVCGETFTFPSNGYKGEYIRSIAENVQQLSDNEYRHPIELVFEDIPDDELQGGDKDEHIDALIARAKTLLGTKQYHAIFQEGLNYILDDIKQDLGEFSIHYQNWFSERLLMDDNSINKALDTLRQGGHLYEKDGATWFASSELGDEKDRVVIRDNGQSTYFASDIAYHMNKLERGFDQIINVWGADHHGYIPRVKAAMQALGADTDKLTVLLVQFAVLYRGSEKLEMSTRSGSFVTLRQLRNEVGQDAARFFYVMRKSEQHMNFDLQLATSKTNENPVFYVQYAYARICSVLKQVDEKGYSHDITLGNEHLTTLSEPQELAVVSQLTRYADVLEKSALQYEPHLLINYLRNLAADFHSYYNAHQFIIEDANQRNARLNLISATKQVLANGLHILKINTPESM